jgi:hypothetical protein
MFLGKQSEENRLISSDLESKFRKRGSYSITLMRYIKKFSEEQKQALEEGHKQGKSHRFCPVAKPSCCPIKVIRYKH